MFPSVNFLFLISLGVLSWLLLCYFNQVERMLMAQHLDLNVETLNATTQAPTFHQDYEIVLNFVCVFACIYLLSKIVDISQDCVAKRLHRRFFKNYLPISETNVRAKKDKYDSLRNNINELRSRKIQLEHELNAIMQKNCLLSCREAINRHLHAGTGQEPVQIRKRVMGQFSLNDSNVKPSIKSTNNGYGNEFTLVWQKYFNNEKFVLREDLRQAANSGDTKLPPIIISTEDLHKAHGLF